MRKRSEEMVDDRIMNDEQVARLLRVSVRTLRRRLDSAPPPGEIDIRKAAPEKFGSRRFWHRSEVEKLLGIKQKEK